MTLNKNIQDILCFKGIVDFNIDYVKIDITDKKANFVSIYQNHVIIIKHKRRFFDERLFT